MSALNESILSGTPAQRSVLLFPVRLETRFRGKQLLIRIIPDEILVENNVASLRKEEIEAGKRFWIQWFIASGDRNREYDAWKALCSAHSLDDAVRISSLCRPPELDRYRIGGDRFHLRPYAYLDSSGHVIDIPEACNEIYAQLENVKAVTPDSETGFLDEYVLTQSLLRIISILDSISFVFNYSSYVVDYLFDSVSACLSYLSERLDSIAGFYEKHPEFKDNPAAFDFKDADYSALLKLQERVAGFLSETKPRVIGLEAMTRMYLEKFDNVFLKVIGRNYREHAEAPYAFLLPDRFMVCAETTPDKDGRTQKFRVEGKDVQDYLPMGLDPQEDPAGYSVDGDGNLSVTGNLRWMVDYQAAVDAGMAVTLDLPDGCNGFQYIYVYGVKRPNTNSSYLESLFNSHRYYDGGVSLVRMGTPTNQLEGCRKEHQPDDEELMRLRYELEIEDAGNRAPEDSDGRLLAQALCIPFENGLNRSMNLENTDISDEAKAESVLWGELACRAMEERKELPAYKYVLNHVAGFVLRYMNPRGIAPVFRIGDRPYGILPTTDFENIRFPIHSLETIYFRLFLDAAVSIGKQWEELLDKVPRAEAMKGRDAERMFMDMVAQTPRSVSYKERVYVDTPFTSALNPNIPAFTQLKRLGLWRGRPVEGSDDEVRSFSTKYLTDCLKEKMPHLEDWQAERLLSDFIDQFSFRLDPWFLSFVQYLRSINKDVSSKQPPLIGAYGWVFDLERKTDQSRDKGEYIIAPSLQHALTAAVLRSAYLTSKSGKNDSHLCINLSSMRVRQALRMVDGIRQGMSTGVILGADMERYLHEANKADQFGIEMDQYIYPLRKLFPQYVNLEAEDGRAEDYQMSVINGERLLSSFMADWDHSGILWEWLYERTNRPEWLEKLRIETKMDDAGLEALCKIIERVQDSYDALNDLLLAEGVHRLVAGDKASFAAISNFMKDGSGTLPSPAVLDTSSEYVVVSHKAGVTLPVADRSDTARILASADPGVSDWLRQMTGHLANYCFTVVHETSHGRRYYSSSLFEVDIDAAEYIYLSSNLNVLKNVIEYRWRQATGNFSGTVRILTGDPAELKEGDYNPKSYSTAMVLNDASLLVDDIRNLLSYGRALRPGDLVPDIDSDEEEEKAVDVEDIRKRYESILDRVSEAADGMEALVNRARKAGRMEDEVVLGLYGLLDTCASGGMLHLSHPFDASLILSNYHPVADHEALAQAIEKQGKFLADVVGCIGTVRERIGEARGIVGTDQDRIPVSRYVEAIQALTMKSVKVLPKFRIDALLERNDVDSISRQLQGYTYFVNLREGFDMDAWLSDIAEVRTGMKYMHDISQLEYLRGFYTGQVSILQPITGQAKALRQENSPRYMGEEWLGAPVSSEYLLDDADSLMLFYAENAGKDGWFCGFVFDSWLEYIPYRKRTAGMVFRCDQPDAEAPQSLLLAVYPECNTKKASASWDVGTLERILASTARLAKMRTISPDVIDEFSSRPFSSLITTRPFEEDEADILGPDAREDVAQLARKAREEGVLELDRNGQIPENLFYQIVG